MPSKKKRNRKRQRRFIFLPVLIALVAVAAVIVAVKLVKDFNSISVEPSSTTVPIVIDPNGYVDQRSATTAPLIVGAEETPTPAPTATPAPLIAPVTDTMGTVEDAEATATPVPLSVRLAPTPMPGDYFLPIYDKALRTQNDDLAIALTIDCCNMSEVMAEYVSTARYYGAKLTLFPTGDALNSTRMKKAFVSCAKDLGYEIECYGYNKKSEYNLTANELVLQLWRQNITLSYLIGRDYEQHFYRPLNIGSQGDQRTHYLLGQMGLYGIGSYTYNYDGVSAETLIKSLANGNIYRFDMSQNALNKYKALIEAATKKGYKCVTMNALFGLNENVIHSTLTLDQQEMPSMEGYVATYYDLKLNTRSYATIALQTRLAALGYLLPERGQERYKADGLYGATTSEAVSRFQAKMGLPATGTADAATQEKLFSNEAKSASQD